LVKINKLIFCDHQIKLIIVLFVRAVLMVKEIPRDSNSHSPRFRMRRN
jgi:hypothetical protein